MRTVAINNSPPTIPNAKVNDNIKQTPNQARHRVAKCLLSSWERCRAQVQHRSHRRSFNWSTTIWLSNNQQHRHRLRWSIRKLTWTWCIHQQRLRVAQKFLPAPLSHQMTMTMSRWWRIGQKKLHADLFDWKVWISWKVEATSWNTWRHLRWNLLHHPPKTSRLQKNPSPVRHVSKSFSCYHAPIHRESAKRTSVWRTCATSYDKTFRWSYFGQRSGMRSC